MRLQRRILLSTATLLAAVLSILAVGCASEADDTPNTYTDPKYGFSFDYPAGWKLVSADTADVSAGADPSAVITVGDPGGAKVGETGVDLIMVRVYELSASVDEASLPQVVPLLEGLISDLQVQDPTWTVESPLRETTVGGVSGYEYTSTFDWDKDTPMKTVSYFLFAGNIEYQLVIQAAERTWAENQDGFAAFLASFKP